MIRLISTLVFLLALPVQLLASDWQTASIELEHATEITVYRSPDCVCCHKWIDHLEQHQFSVIDQLSHDMLSVKQQLGLPLHVASCHTAVVNGYLIEGHVPADDIKRLIRDAPASVKALSVPEMPVGTPGMEMGARKDDFAVIAIDHNDQSSIYNVYTVNPFTMNYQSALADTD